MHFPAGLHRGRLPRSWPVQPLVHPGGEVERHALADPARHRSPGRRERSSLRRVLRVSDRLHRRWQRYGTGKPAGLSVNLAEAWNGTSWRVQAIAESPRLDQRFAARGLLHVAERLHRGRLFRQRRRAGARRGRTVGRHALAHSGRTQARQVHLVLWSVVLRLARSAELSSPPPGLPEQRARPGRPEPCTEAWNGTTWRIQAVPLPHGAPGGILTAVSCTSTSACTATGSNFSTAGQTLAERWNGTRWRVQPTPNPANSGTSREEVAN